MSQGLPMSIDARCQEQRSAADRMFMDFKYTHPGSKEQIQALATLSFLIGMWADFLTYQEKRIGSSVGPRSRSLLRARRQPLWAFHARVLSCLNVGIGAICVDSLGNW